MNMKQQASVAFVMSFLALSLVACREDPQKAKVRFVASGDRFFAEKNYAEAIIQYRNAVAKDGSYGAARFKLGDAYEKSGDFRNALRELVRAADLMPADMTAQLRAGKLLIAVGQYPEAKARAIAVLEKNPTDVNALVIMANALAGMKDVDGAIEQIEGAIEAEPRLAFSYANLGMLQVREGQRAAAEQTFKRAVEVAPKSVSAHLNLGNFFWASKRNDEAEREFKAAVAIEPGSASANRVLAAFYALNGRPNEAEPHLKTLAASTSDPLPTLALADFYLAQAKYREATEVLQPLVKTTAAFASSKVRLAAIDFTEGRKDAACRHRRS